MVLAELRIDGGSGLYDPRRKIHRVKDDRQGDLALNPNVFWKTKEAGITKEQ